jgi:hypothetical protein
MNKNVIKEVGNSLNASNLEYAEIYKYFPNNKENQNTSSSKILLSKIKFFYLRNEYLLSIQYIYQEKADIISNNSDKSSFLYPPLLFFGPDPTTIKQIYAKNKTTCIIDEIELSLSLNEHIYQVKGFFNFEQKQITNFSIKTTRGQFVEFGPFPETNFVWDCFFNQKIFEGFIIGWNSYHINYFAAIFPVKINEEEKETLTDVTYIQHSIPNISPYYQSKLVGPFDLSTSIKDPYANSNILSLYREGKIYLEEINIYSCHTILQIELVYNYTEDNAKRFKIEYTANNFHKNECKISSLLLRKDEFINDYQIGYNKKGICKITMQTNTNKFLKCATKIESEKEEGCTEKGNTMLLGIVAGYNSSIMCMRFYYKKLKSN